MHAEVKTTPAVIQLDNWICDTCTLHNSIKYASCEACGNLRAGAYSDSPELFKHSKVPPHQPDRFNTVDFQNPNAKQHQLYLQANTPTVPRERSIQSNIKYNNQQRNNSRDQPQHQNGQPSTQAQQHLNYHSDTVLKPIMFDNPFNRHYFLLYSTQSQYSMGAVSACTTMAVQAALTLLKDTTGHDKPFGCSSEMIDDILMKGSKYKNVNHQDIFDVMKANQQLNESLYHVSFSFSFFLT